MYFCMTTYNIITSCWFHMYNWNTLSDNMSHHVVTCLVIVTYNIMMKHYVTLCSDTCTWCEIIVHHVMTLDYMNTHIGTCCHRGITCYIMLQHVDEWSVIVEHVHIMSEHVTTSSHIIWCLYVHVHMRIHHCNIVVRFYI